MAIPEGPLAHEPTDTAWWGGLGLIVTPQTNVSRIMCRAPVFFCGLLSWGPGSGFSMIFQSSTTAISQPWHPTVTLTEWQDATFDCHVLYSTEPFSSWGCHQGSTSTGIAVFSGWVCVCARVFMCMEHVGISYGFFSIHVQTVQAAWFFFSYVSAGRKMPFMRSDSVQGNGERLHGDSILVPNTINFYTSFGRHNM